MRGYGARGVCHGYRLRGTRHRGSEGQGGRAGRRHLPGVQTMTTTVVGGRRLWLRLLEPNDANLLRRFFWRLSNESVYRRFMAPIKAPSNALVARLVDVDHCDREALIALDQRGILGVARYGTVGAAHDVAVGVA